MRLNEVSQVTVLLARPISTIRAAQSRVGQKQEGSFHFGNRRMLSEGRRKDDNAKGDTYNEKQRDLGEK